MSLFDDRLEEYMSDATDPTDIRCTTRFAWHYAFRDFDIRIWNGEGRLHTSDGNEWLGSFLPKKKGNVHKTPRLSDGRDGTAPIYEFGLGYLDKATYQALKEDETIVADMPLTCYVVLLRTGEGLRPDTPIDFFKGLTMQSRSFDESLSRDGISLTRRYKINILAKDGNSGRSEQRSRTYADTMQKEYALQIGAGVDRGCEFLASLAYRTYKPPK